MKVVKCALTKCEIHILHIWNVQKPQVLICEVITQNAVSHNPHVPSESAWYYMWHWCFHMLSYILPVKYLKNSMGLYHVNVSWGECLKNHMRRNGIYFCQVNCCSTLKCAFFMKFKKNGFSLWTVCKRHPLGTMHVCTKSDGCYINICFSLEKSGGLTNWPFHLKSHRHG